MHCSICQAQLLTYLRKTSPEVKAHLASCAACREAVEEVQVQLKQFRQEAQAVPPLEINADDILPKGSFRPSKKNVSFTKSNLLVAAAVLPVAFAFALLASDSFYYWVSDRTPLSYDPLDRLVSEGYALQTDAEEATEDIRFEITEVVADESQLHLYYESEDLQGEENYIPVFHPEAFILENQEEVWDMEMDDAQQRYIDREDHKVLEENSDGKLRGRIALPAPDYENGSLAFSLDTFVSADAAINQSETLYAEISLEVPFERMESTRYDLHDTEITVDENHSYILEQMMTGPAATSLVYRLGDTPQGEHMGHNHPVFIETGNFQSSMINEQMNSTGGSSNTVHYESLIHTDMKELVFHFDDYLLSYMDFFETPLDLSATDAETLETPLGDARVEQTSDTRLITYFPDADNLDTGGLHLDITDNEQSLTRVEQSEIFISDKNHDIYEWEDLTQSMMTDLKTPLQHEDEVVFEIDGNDLSNLMVNYHGYSERISRDEFIVIEPRLIETD